ncbi:Rrf2 family transcriptional regulator [Mucilaginibacter ginsenosidivorax]|uniref:Rrf2 family transcriptional regulator n=1 Tax=Mucilaginibacter ginsenosidivorax TaxID=862126 RepID=A0A5B8WCS6_9SPHI|nr:Rrf2 family transcriptional regulator [Mucilaginibacter ginsenosidivorax]QEC79748.1 Rrf2 family transcriptional regulator [Mucilaginibacter ginsenosidivorax]
MNGQFQIAVHILTLLNAQPGELLSSDYIAGSININPVLVRKEISNLRKYGLIDSKEGKAGGYSLALPADKISFSDVYRAVKVAPALGQAKNKPNPACPVGKQISQHLDDLAEEVDTTIFNKLKTMTLADFSSKFE